MIPDWRWGPDGNLARSLFEHERPFVRLRRRDLHGQEKRQNKVGLDRRQGLVIRPLQ